MSATLTPPKAAIVYPESDGKPMADNTKQLLWIVMLYTGLDGVFRDSPDVFVGANQNWYPVEGEPHVVCAPDVYVAFGRPKGHRGSYVQWEENDVAPQVVIEILSPGNTFKEMAEKLQFYDDYGVEEYYVYDPESNDLTVYGRGKMALRMIRPAHGHVSPRLGVRFDLSGDEMAAFGPDGRRFLNPREIAAERERAERLAALSAKLLAGSASDLEKVELARLVNPSE